MPDSLSWPSGSCSSPRSPKARGEGKGLRTKDVDPGEAIRDVTSVYWGSVATRRRTSIALGPYVIDVDTAVRAAAASAGDIHQAARALDLRSRSLDVHAPGVGSRYAGAMAFTRIAADHRIMAGVPCIRGTRIPVATIIGMIAEAMTPAEILADYPQLTEADIRQALQFAAAAVDQAMLPLPATA